MQNLKENWLVLSKITWVTFSQAKNNDFNLESKMEELSQNKNSKQPDQSDAMWKFISPWK